jgi:hypothetical protein
VNQSNHAHGDGESGVARLRQAAAVASTPEARATEWFRRLGGPESAPPPNLVAMITYAKAAEEQTRRRCEEEASQKRQLREMARQRAGRLRRIAGWSLAAAIVAGFVRLIWRYGPNPFDSGEGFLRFGQSIMWEAWYLGGKGRVWAMAALGGAVGLGLVILLLSQMSPGTRPEQGVLCTAIGLGAVGAGPMGLVVGIVLANLALWLLAIGIILWLIGAMFSSD